MLVFEGFAMISPMAVFATFAIPASGCSGQRACPQLRSIHVKREQRPLVMRVLLFVKAHR